MIIKVNKETASVFVRLDPRNKKNIGMGNSNVYIWIQETKKLLERQNYTRQITKIINLYI